MIDAVPAAAPIPHETSTVTPGIGPAVNSKPPARSEQIAQAIAVAVLLAAPALMRLHSAVVDDADIWWHLRTGEWIAQHHAIPRIDSFSGPNAGKPWQAYSWLFDLLVFGLFHRFGLVGIVGYLAAMMLAIACALYRMVGRIQTDFAITALLVFGGCLVMGHLYSPRPWLFTILFFILELNILMQVRRTGRLRGLLWLPIVFALWSNLHIQFIDGLVVLGLVVIESAAGLRSICEKTRLGIVPATAAFLGSLLATLINPYSWHVYGVAYGLVSQTGVLNRILELKAIPFRDMIDWSILALALCATAVLARRPRLHLLETALLAFAIYAGFRSQRDAWLIAVAGTAVLASALPARARIKGIAPRETSQVLSAVAAALLVASGFRIMHITQVRLETQLEASYPVNAVAAVQRNHYPGPLYNNFDWGGYLIWALRMPVAVDGRAAFYGDQALDRSAATWAAAPDWKSDPLLKKARLVIAPSDGPLAGAMKTDQAYRVVYEDRVATVLVTQP